MTGLNDTDIRLNSEWQLTQATDGDAPLCSGLECLYQNIVLEALTQPGDVFYDAEFGWGLYDFIQSEDTELTRLEITQRVRLKLQKREVILRKALRSVLRSRMTRSCCTAPSASRRRTSGASWTSSSAR